MEQLAYLLAGAALTWAFYFIQRRIERRGTTEAIDRHQKLLALKQGLASAHTSLDELRRAYPLDRRFIPQRPADEVAVERARWRDMVARA